MKLLEIIDTKIDYSSEKALPINSPEIGSGFYSKVYDNDEWTVKKISMDPDYTYNPNDCYNFYVTYLIEHNISSSNPFFPRIYNIHKNDSTTVAPKSNYSFEIERLFELVDLNKASLKSIFNNIGFYYDRDSTLYAVTHLKDIIKSFVHFGKYNNDEINNIGSINEKFLEAISILKKIKEEYEKSHTDTIVWDLGYRNMMARMGKTGTQLVFTDPFE